MDYLDLITTNGDIIPVSETLCQEHFVIPKGMEKATRWFVLRPKAGRVFVSVQADAVLTATLECRIASTTVFTAAVQAGTLLSLSMLAAWSAFRVRLASDSDNECDCKVAMMV